MSPKEFKALLANAVNRTQSNDREKIHELIDQLSPEMLESLTKVIEGFLCAEDVKAKKKTAR